MQFLRSIWKILHLTEYFYTGTAHGARNNYQVCVNAYRCDPSDQKLDQMICSIVHNYATSLHCIMGQTHTS